MSFLRASEVRGQKSGMDPIRSLFTILHMIECVKEENIEAVVRFKDATGLWGPWAESQ